MQKDNRYGLQKKDSAEKDNKFIVEDSKVWDRILRNLSPDYDGDYLSDEGSNKGDYMEADDGSN